MTRAIVVAAMLAVVGCGGGDEGLTIAGGPVADQELVARVAQKHCDRALEGRLQWVDASVDGEHQGYCTWHCSDCPMDAWAVKEPSALWSSMAHEIGHWCLRTSDEDAVRAWTASVYAEALTDKWPGAQP